MLLADRRYTAFGADSLQSAIMFVVPELRNAYLKDLGLMAVDNGSGVLVLVDMETDRQYIGQGMLGAQLRAPGGGPHPIALHLPGRGGRPDVGRGRPSRSHPEPGPRGALGAPGPSRADLPGLYVAAGLFLFAWIGFAAVAEARRHQTPLSAGTPPSIPTLPSGTGRAPA